MCEEISKSILNEPFVAATLPSLTPKEIDHPETVLTKFCEDNYLDRVKTIFWEIVAMAASEITSILMSLQPGRCWYSTTRWTF
jgi:hypothetical protein